MKLKKYDIEEIIDDEAVPSIPNEYQIKYWSYNRSVNELVEMYNGEELIVPSLQREYVWNYEQASLFIDSVIRGLPIPSFFITEIKNKLLIIDGLQRVHTLSIFIRNEPFEKWGKKEFRLSKNNTSILKQIRGLTYEELPLFYQNKIVRALMNIIEFSQISPENNYSAMYQIFERINSTGRSLEAQEIRNAAYNSTFNNELNEEAQNDTFKSIYPVKKEIYASEMLLRFLSVRYIVNNSNVKSYNLKNTLNEFMALMQAKELNLIINEQNFPLFYKLIDCNYDYKYEMMLFEKTVEWISRNIGKDCFRNIKTYANGEINYKNSIQNTLAETLLIATANKIENNENLIAYKNVRNELNELLKNEEFNYLLGSATTNVANIRRRLELIEGIY